LLVYMFPSVLCSDPIDCTSGKVTFIYITVLTSSFLLGVCTSMLIISLSVFLGTLSNNNDTKTK